MKVAAPFLAAALAAGAWVSASPAHAASLGVDVQVSTHQNRTDLSITSPTFSTSEGNELLVAFLASDGPESSSISFASVAGGGLTWQLRERTNTQAGTAEIWEAAASQKLTNVSVTAKRSGGSFDGLLNVVSFSNADLDLAAGAVASANGASGAPSVSLNATRSGSLAWAVGNDWDNPIARVVGTSQKRVDQFMPSVGDTYWVQRADEAASAVGSKMTLNDLTPVKDRWNVSAIEIRPASASGIPVTSSSTTSTTVKSVPSTTTTVKPTTTTTTIKPVPTTTTTIKPTTTTTSVVTTPASNSCASPAAFPNASNVGAHSAFTATASGTYTITQNGAVINGMDINGEVDILANNVTIENSRITSTNWYGIKYGTAYDTGYTGLKVINSTITSPAGKGVDVGASDYGIGNLTANGTLEVGCSDISGFKDGIDTVAGNIHDNYIHGLPSGSGLHTQDIYVWEGGGLNITHNTLINESAQANATAAVYIAADESVQHDVTVDDNLMAGGAYTTYAGPANSYNIVFKNNQFSTQVAPNGGYYGVRYTWPSASSNVWSNNTWADGPKAGTAAS